MEKSYPSVLRKHGWVVDAKGKVSGIDWYAHRSLPNHGIQVHDDGKWYDENSDNEGLNHGGSPKALDRYLTRLGQRKSESLAVVDQLIEVTLSVMTTPHDMPVRHAPAQEPEGFVRCPNCGAEHASYMTRCPVCLAPAQGSR